MNRIYRTNYGFQLRSCLKFPDNNVRSATSTNTKWGAAFISVFLIIVVMSGLFLTWLIAIVFITTRHQGQRQKINCKKQMKQFFHCSKLKKILVLLYFVQRRSVIFVAFKLFEKASVRTTFRFNCSSMSNGISKSLLISRIIS